MEKAFSEKRKNDEVLSARKRDGGEITLNISDEAIKEVCDENGFPFVKHGGKIKSVCSCGCGANNIRTIVGVASCNECSGLCSSECPLRDGEKVALWGSEDDVNGEVFFFNPQKSTLKLLDG